MKYMEIVQHDITAQMRAILVDWMVEVAQEYKLVSETLYLSVSYVDRYLSAVPVQRNQLQLVGVTCMLLASKYEEIYAPQVSACIPPLSVHALDDEHSQQGLLQIPCCLLHCRWRSSASSQRTPTPGRRFWRLRERCWTRSTLS